MSAFGYGSSYQIPAAQPQVGSWAPQQGGNLSMGSQPLNFAPDVTQAWDTRKYLYGTSDSTIKNPIGQVQHGHQEDWRQMPWNNPIQDYFGAQSPVGVLNTSLLPSGALKQYGIPSSWSYPDTPKDPGAAKAPGQFTYNDQNGYQINSNPFQATPIAPGKNGETGGAGGTATAVISPRTPQDLYAQIGQLSLDQLQMLTPQLNSIRNRFAAAGQDFSNAYANPLYAKQAEMTQGQAQDWLSRSYDLLQNRLNDYGLL